MEIHRVSNRQNCINRSVEIPEAKLPAPLNEIEA
jgi:hypothetical protein